MSQRGDEGNGEVGGQQEITTKIATQSVETGKAGGILATCAHTARRRSERGTDASPPVRRAPWPK
jgi:hypothetical protein